MFFFDLHVHTVKGSSDSNLSPYELIEEARRIGLRGVCLTEHGGGWDRHDFQRFAQEQDIVLVRALEVDTDMGHVLVFGLDSYIPGMSTVEELRRVVDGVGGFMVAAHPFRGLFNPPPYNFILMNRNRNGDLPESVAAAAEHPLFQLVDEIEVMNGANTDLENRFALAVARRLGKQGTGGSDAHSRHGLGKCVTVFEGDVHNEEELIQALKARRFYAAEGLHIGRMRLASHLL